MFAGVTGQLWIPVPTKLFHNGGSGDWSPPCTCNFAWQGAKPRTPTREILVLHGCRNLRFSSISFSTLFAWYFCNHGEGLSREPYIDYFPYFGPYLMAFLVTTVISEYLPLFEWYYLGYRVSHRICTLKDSVPDGSLKKQFCLVSLVCVCVYIYTHIISYVIYKILQHTHTDILCIFYMCLFIHSTVRGSERRCSLWTLRPYLVPQWP